LCFSTQFWFHWIFLCVGFCFNKLGFFNFGGFGSPCDLTSLTHWRIADFSVCSDFYLLRQSTIF
jgi:hypothetical protein